MIIDAEGTILLPKGKHMRVLRPTLVVQAIRRALRNRR